MKTTAHSSPWIDSNMLKPIKNLITKAVFSAHGS